jgi:hypothetical protein
LADFAPPAAGPGGLIPSFYGLRSMRYVSTSTPGDPFRMTIA